MKVRPYERNPYKRLLVQVIRGTQVDLDAIRAGFETLLFEDRDCLRYVPQLLACES